MDLDRPNNGVLIVDADEVRRRELEELAASLGQAPVYTAGTEEWRYRLEAEAGIRAVLLGPCTRPEEQLRLHEALREERPHLPIILYGAEHETARLAAEAAAGSFARMLDAPVQGAVLAQALDEAFRHAGKQPPGGRGPELFRSLVGKSDGIRQVRRMIQRVANTDATVLILGESGTGKEVVARNLHYHSSRRGKPFVAVNCRAIPAELLESELFGHERGALPGEVAERQGRFEQAGGGTLFLDEIGEISAAVQAKLLRALQEGVFERVGGSRALEADVRLIAATHGNLEGDVREGRFREDLYYRLNVFPIVMPPLRERADDIPLLITEINARLRQERGAAARLSPAALATLQRYAWPGNVRELANLIERLAILHDEELVDVDDLPARHRATRANAPVTAAAEGVVLPLTTLPPDGLKLKEYLSNIEYGLIVQALTRTGGVVAHAAQLLGLRRTTLVEKLHKYGMRRENAAPAAPGAEMSDKEAAAR